MQFKKWLKSFAVTDILIYTNCYLKKKIPFHLQSITSYSPLGDYPNPYQYLFLHKTKIA